MNLKKYTVIMAAVISAATATLNAANIGKNVYGLFTETFDGMRIETLNPGDVDGGFIGAWAAGEVYPALSSDVLISTEGSTSMKAIVYGNGGWWIQFGYNGVDNPIVPTNMSAYAGGSIEFMVRTGREMSIKIEWQGGSKEFFVNSDLGVPLNMSWRRVSVPLSSFTGIDLTKITIPAGFHMQWMATPPYSRTFWIDNVYWKKAGTGSANVVLKNRSDNSTASSITWSGVTPGVTKWKAADQYMEISMDYAHSGWGMLLYTENSAANASPRYSGIGNPAGLIGYSATDPSVSSTTLPMCWRVVDSSTNTLTINRGATVMEFGDPVNYPDRLWSGELTNEYPCFLWMQDRQAANFDQSYATAWSNQGIQHAEATWGGAKSPNYVYFGADFTSALVPRTYSTNKLTLELFYE